MKSNFLIAVSQLAAERNLPREIVYSAIEAALVSAYKKDNMAVGEDISVKLNPGTGEVKVYVRKEVVEEVTDDKVEISLVEAKKVLAESKVGDVLELESDAYQTGRIAAQTAKQVVIQRLREAERELVFEEYIDKEGDIVAGTVQRINPRQISLDIGRTEAIIPAQEQVPTERYRPGQRIKVYVKEVRRSTKGPEIVVSRASPDLLRRLFELEVPEIFHGSVEIKSIARDPGIRSKVAVTARQEGIDPVGACVGLRGIRIQNIVNELQGEKIDVVQWNKDPSSFIANALSPAQVLRVDLDSEEAVAIAVVSDRHLSLAIGREGQNARLAASLTGWRVEIKSSVAYEVDKVRSGESTESLDAVTSTEPVVEVKPVRDDVIDESTEREISTVESVEEEEESKPIDEAVTAQIVEVGQDLTPTDISEESVPEESEIEPEGESGLSPEEAFLAETFAPIGESEDLKEQEAQEDSGTADDVWSIPAHSLQTSGIRFAEDILGERGPREGGRRGRGRGGKGVATPGKGKAKKGQLSGTPGASPQGT